MPWDAPNCTCRSEATQPAGPVGAAGALDAPEADSLGQPDLEIMKTLANLLAVGLALAARIDKSALKVPAQSKREVMRSTDLLPAGLAQ